MQKRFVESLKFPISEVNRRSSSEKGPGRPPFWEMVFYWTRKPLIGARAVIAASLLPEDVDAEKFKKMICLDKRSSHRHNPEIPSEWKEFFSGKKLLDPFAGFGNIPLEALRLGLSATAVELIPTACIFLKAVLEYPKRFGKELVEDVETWGNWITEKLKEDKDLKEIYDDDVAVYIGTWEIKCPWCKRWTPAIGNFWLARVKDSRKRYTRLAFMEPKLKGDEVAIDVVDLNKIHKDISEAKVNTKSGEILIDGKTYKVPEANIASRKSQLTCLACGNLIRFADKNGEHYTDSRKGGNEFYVKFALRRYHEGDEQFARQRILVKVKVDGRDLVFEPATAEDNEKLLKAKEKLREFIERNDPDVPSEQIPPYGNIGGGGHFLPLNYGIEKWFMLFNPRQLLTLIKIVRLIREVGKKVEAEKTFEYAEAVAIYLSVAMVKFADYNTITTMIDVANPWGIKIAHALSNRGISMNWNWGDTSPYFANRISGILQDTNSLKRTLDGIYHSLSYLTLYMSDNNNYIPSLLQSDATSLSLGEKFDLIVTDPPYADDVPYTELSDFYYVWLKRALSDSDGKKLVPRFHKTAFFKKIGPKWIEIKTQWEEFAKKEISEKAGRFLNKDEPYVEAQNHFQNLFSQAFISMREHLKDDGLLVTYYAHTDPESWASLIEAGWKRAGLKITRAIPLNTESQTSIVSRGKVSLDTSIVAVWRKKERKENIKISELKKKMIERATHAAKDCIKHGYKELDLLYGVVASALEEVTSYEKVISPSGELSTRKILEEHIYPSAIRGIVNAISGGDTKSVLSTTEGLFYTAYKVLFGSKTLNANDIVLLTLSTNTEARALVKSGLLKEKKSGGKLEFTLYTPDILGESALNTRELQRFLAEKDLKPHEPEPKNSVHILQLLEYYSLLTKSSFDEGLSRLKELYPAEFEEAITIARLVSEYYSSVFEKDIEANLRKNEHFEVILMRRLLSKTGGI